jgi:[acyl-carrier-protein] S-malonyltransferase
MKKAIVFPGQGSQFIGMGKDVYDAFPTAKAVFQEVDDALGKKLSDLIFDGNADDLNLTENTQPALMAVSVAIWRVLEEQGKLSFNSDDVLLAAGHSLGEYSALTATGALALSDTARLLQIRGSSMQQAVPVGVGAMAAILGLDFDDVEAIAKEASGEEVCTAANDNANGQVVVSGHKGAVEAAIALASERGARKSVLLPVSAPFHCPLMQPAADRMAEALAKVEIQVPAVPVVANVKASSVTDPNEIRQLLVDQVTGSVRWRESVLYMKEQGVEQIIEVGAGKVLAGLTRRIDRDLQAKAIQTVDDIAEA